MDDRDGIRAFVGMNSGKWLVSLIAVDVALERCLAS